MWPHDNGLIALGLARYGLKEPVPRVLDGIFGASQGFPLRRLAELFCGFPRRSDAGPTAYPLACAPQAWSAARGSSCWPRSGCAIGSQYAVKNRVDVLGWQFPPAWSLWMAVGILLALVAGDNLLWRLAGWVAARAFVELGGDLRLDLFEHPGTRRAISPTAFPARSR